MHISVHCTFYSFYFLFVLLLLLLLIYFFSIFILFLPIFIDMLLCYVSSFIFIFYFYFFLHCPLSGPVLTYISLLIIPCMIVYVTNKPWTPWWIWGWEVLTFKTFFSVFMFVQCVFSSKDPNSPSIYKFYQVLMDLVDMNLCVLNGKDPSNLDKSIRKTLRGELFLKSARIHIEETYSYFVVHFMTLAAVNISQGSVSEQTQSKSYLPYY